MNTVFFTTAPEKGWRTVKSSNKKLNRNIIFFLSLGTNSRLWKLRILPFEIISLWVQLPSATPWNLQLIPNENLILELLMGHFFSLPCFSRQFPHPRCPWAASTCVSTHNLLTHLRAPPKTSEEVWPSCHQHPLLSLQAWKHRGGWLCKSTEEKTWGGEAVKLHRPHPQQHKGGAWQHLREGGCRAGRWWQPHHSQALPQGTSLQMKRFCHFFLIIFNLFLLIAMHTSLLRGKISCIVCVQLGFGSWRKPLPASTKRAPLPPQSPPPAAGER